MWTASQANDINASGTVVGFVAAQGASAGFIYNRGTMSLIPTLPGSGFSLPYAINSGGAVAGGASFDTFDAPFLYSERNISQLPLLGGDTYGYAVAINDSGQIVGLSYPGTGIIHSFVYSNGNISQINPLVPGGSVGVIVLNSSGQAVGTADFNGTGSIRHAFLYAGGTTFDLGVPAGFSSSQAESINSIGVIVGEGYFTNYGGASHAFLYVNGSWADLNNLIPQNSGWLLRWASGINEAGQIVGTVTFDGEDTAYRLTPVPIPSMANPPSGSGQTSILTFTFTDLSGWQNLDVVNVLINNSLDGRNACYLAYSRSAGVLYLVPDAGGGLSSGLSLGKSGTVSNSQCSVASAGSSAIGNGNTLTLTLNITFTTSFAGNKVAYMAARDLTQNNSGWMPLGVWQVPGEMQSTTTAMIGASPASGSGLGPTPYPFMFSDTKGYQDLGVENILINTALDGRHACYLAYARQINTLYLVNDNGDGLLPGKSLSTTGTLNNSQCTVSWGNSAVSASVNNLNLSLAIGISGGFGPNLIFYLAARDMTEANNTGWQAMGTWAVQ
jgi:probable HAF family extracellular repeat protein